MKLICLVQLSAMRCRLLAVWRHWCGSSVVQHASVASRPGVDATVPAGSTTAPGTAGRQNAVEASRRSRLCAQQRRAQESNSDCNSRRNVAVFRYCWTAGI